ncbi:hypothetical protein TIFTF001_017204 [Ficus carica]|uniref:Uncharacterized protein n=1 Tax=Ficus carica TaxID=3494 RepID=A0AA88D9G1_FICCA|nr:hypothetical protein TIFTF001_017204 [Ficus carica]
MLATDCASIEHLGVRQGACLLRELLIVATFSDGGDSGKMFDFLECRLTISQSLALGPVLRVALVIGFEWRLTISRLILRHLQQRLLWRRDCKLPGKRRDLDGEL